jgi:hypothetical protein
MIHERLDIEHWEAVFSLPRLREEARKKGHRPPEACGITGPYDIAVLEQLRDEAFATRPDLEREPTDVFVWNLGEPEQRAVTKISGLPYREAGKPWPHSHAGTPLNFVAQFCFADSRDIIPKLPADVLLIFIQSEERAPGKYDFSMGGFPERDDEIVFEWVALRDFPLVTRKEIPKTGMEILPCYAAIHRTWDYPTVEWSAYRQVAEHICPVVQATKIGGLPPWFQGEEDIPGMFLCSLNSIWAEISEPFPFLNVSEAISEDERWEGHHLMFGDVGLMYFFINTYGDLRWAMQCG